MQLLAKSVIVIGITVVSVAGCSGRYGRRGRTYHADPFGAPREARVTGAEVVAKGSRSAPDPTPVAAPDLIRAGYEEAELAGPDAPSGPAWSRPNDHDATNLLDDSADPTSSADSPRGESARNRPARRDAILDHAPDYSWVQGTLEYSAFGGGVWRVRYAPLSADDENGGSVTLDALPDAGGFAADDTVWVEGQLVRGGQSRMSHSPLYRVRRIDHVRRVDRIGEEDEGR